MDDNTDRDQKLRESGKCFYCDREGGTPFLMTAQDELHCSRCFEDFSPSEFAAWLEDGSVIVERAPSVASEEDALHLGHTQALRCEASKDAA